jgi:hypothetical protein
MPHDSRNLQPFISDCDPGDETDTREPSAASAPSLSEPALNDAGERLASPPNGNSRNGTSALARNRAPFPAGF